MKNLFVLPILLAALLATACSGESVEPIQPDEPSGETPAGSPGEGTVSGEATVDSVSVSILESLPVQVEVTVMGTLSDSCTSIDEINTERAENTFNVTITTIRDADLICTQVLEPFEETISLDVQGLPAGEYTVDVNGVAETFTLDNPAPVEGNEEPEGEIFGPIPADAMTETVMPDQATVEPGNVLVLSGTLPDGCTGYLQVVQRRTADNDINLEFGRSLPGGVVCTQAFTDYTYELPLEDLTAGETYIVNVNGEQMAEFTAE